ncbi:unnamed protein product [Ambrosiozyma monospora]|uniref:Unnamed protein product n=1 Tax=Ambrosiozyma monospora TaxID=43982 RepID=A0A9W6T2Q3_AMBMO|nr:unnamed protein product [Ambrosiozyma monospora]
MISYRVVLGLLKESYLQLDLQDFNPVFRYDDNTTDSRGEETDEEAEANTASTSCKVDNVNFTSLGIKNPDKDYMGLRNRRK